MIGFFATLTGPHGRFVVSVTTRQFVMIGICGGYTTFSAFSFETLNLLLDGKLFYAGMNITLSFVLCLISVWLGYEAAMMLNHIK